MNGEVNQTCQKDFLATGCAGFIGANFVPRWLNSNPYSQVTVLDALIYAGNPQNLESVKKNKAHNFVHSDILDIALVEKLLQEQAIDTIVCFAPESHVYWSIHGPAPFFETNIEGTHSFLKVAKKIWIDAGNKQYRFHYVSTDEAYGTLEPDPQAFTELYQSSSPYAVNKASSDYIVRSHHYIPGLNTTISNCSNNYGPYHFQEKLIPLIIVNCLECKPLPVYVDGKQIYDWLYVEDHCQDIDLILKNDRVGEAYNIGGIMDGPTWI